MSRTRGLNRRARPPSWPRERAGPRRTGSFLFSLGARMAGRSLATCSTRHHDQENPRRHHRCQSGSWLGGAGAHPCPAVAPGRLRDHGALSIHYRGGRSRGTNLLWEINGTEGDLQVTADGGQAQIFELTVRGGNGAQSSLGVLPVPEQYRFSPLRGPSANVAQAYARFARDYREGTHLCPTFDDAVTRHRMLDAIETAAATRQRQTPG